MLLIIKSLWIFNNHLIFTRVFYHSLLYNNRVTNFRERTIFYWHLSLNTSKGSYTKIDQCLEVSWNFDHK
ncbi:hypothetical protein Hanom_Chr15g01389981 [Helianthus anomalus]